MLNVIAGLGALGVSAALARYGGNMVYGSYLSSLSQDDEIGWVGLLQRAVVQKANSTARLLEGAQAQALSERDCYGATILLIRAARNVGAAKFALDQLPEAERKDVLHVYNKASATSRHLWEDVRDICLTREILPDPRWRRKSPVQARAEAAKVEREIQKMYEAEKRRRGKKKRVTERVKMKAVRAPRARPGRSVRQIVESMDDE